MVFGGYLTKGCFLHLVCQKSRQGRGIDAQWFATMFGVSKKTALTHLDQMVKDDEIVRDVLPWRTNAKKFYFRPSGRTQLNYRNRVFLPDYKAYMQAMLDA